MIKVNKANKLDVLFGWGLVAIVFCLPLYRILSTSLIVLSGLLWLIIPRLGQRLISAAKNSYFVLFSIFYLLLIISFFLSQDKNTGYIDLETKLSLIVFPLFFWAGPGIGTKTVIRISRAFVLGCLLAIFLCIINAFKNSFNNPYSSGEFNISIFSDTINLPWWKLIWKSYSFFNYEDYSFIIHPSYFALYLTFAVFIVSSSSLWFVSDKKKFKILNIFLILFLIINIFLLQSRAGIIALFVYFIWLLYFINLSKFKKFGAIISFAFLLFIVVFSGRFELISSKIRNPSWSQIEAANIRIPIWHEAVSLISQKPVFGHTIGDAKADLNDDFRIKNIDEAFNENLNVHNDFLELTMKLGIIGLSVFVIILFLPLFHHHSLNSIYIFFFIIIFIHFFFESMLERYAGVAFFSYFYCYINFCLINPDNFMTAKNKN